VGPLTHSHTHTLTHSHTHTLTHSHTHTLTHSHTHTHTHTAVSHTQQELGHSAALHTTHTQRTAGRSTHFLRCEHFGLVGLLLSFGRCQQRTLTARYGTVVVKKCVFSLSQSISLYVVTDLLGCVCISVGILWSSPRICLYCYYSR
jgi:hypothetical protein